MWLLLGGLSVCFVLEYIVVDWKGYIVGWMQLWQAICVQCFWSIFRGLHVIGVQLYHFATYNDTPNYYVPYTMITTL
jgi:hypothetical protein